MFYHTYLCGKELDTGAPIKVDRDSLLGGKDALLAKDLAGFSDFVIKLLKRNFSKIPPPGSNDAFKVSYVSPDYSLHYFQSFVFQKIIEAYQKEATRYHSLYFSIVQSSGFGKSRLVLEAGKSHLNLVYCCLRPSDSNGYPICNAELYNFLQQINAVDSLKTFIICTFYVASSGELRNEMEPQLFRRENETDENEKFAKFWSEVIQLTRDCFKSNVLLSNVTSFFIQSQSDKFSRAYKEEFFQNGTYVEVDENGQFSDTTANFLTHLLIVFDEARMLLNESLGSEMTLFRNLRKAQQELDPKSCVLVFIDTLSTISQFQPSSSKDPSLRPTIKKNALLPPFFELQTANPAGSDVVRGSRRERELAQILAFGRPIWYAYYFSKPSSVTMDTITEAIVFAKEKLTFVRTVQDGGLSEYSIIACMAARFGIRGIMDHTTASDLMSSYMATCVYIGNDRIRICVQYAAEPIIAEAACQALHGTITPIDTKSISWTYDIRTSSFSSHLELFASKVTAGLVNVGEMGELICRIALSLAYDLCHLNNPDIGRRYLFTDPISLRSFFSYLIPVSYRCQWKSHFGTDIIGIPKKDLDEFHVAFTSWIILYKSSSESFNQENLEIYYNHRCAIILPTNHKGADLVIPMKNVKTGLFSYTIIQSKLYSHYGPSRFDFAGEQLDPNNHFDEESLNEHYIGLYMEADYKAHASEFTKLDKNAMTNFHESYPRHIMLVDLPLDHFDNLFGQRASGFRETMKLIQQSDIDVIDGNYRAEVLKRMTQISFNFCRM